MDPKPTFFPTGNIPVRTSSRSPEKGYAIKLKRLRDLSKDRKACHEEAKMLKKRLELGASFDTNYWTARRDLVDQEIEDRILTKEISIENMRGPEDRTKAFLESADGQRLIQQEESLKLESIMYQAQAKKMASDDPDATKCRSYVQMFVGAVNGLGLKNFRGERLSSLQSDFRKDLITKMGSQNPEARKRSQLWCPVTSRYWPKDIMRAGHLFPSKCGEATMEVIFGLTDSGHSELFEAENGILWSSEVEKRFEGGLFVIVPDVPNQPTEHEVEIWEASDPKEYKIRVLDPNHMHMQDIIFETESTWADLDNKRLEFKTNFRPRAKYLYFAYCAAMLRRSFTGNHLKASSADPREKEKLWGVPGSYMPEGMLMGFVEEMGHEYESLLEGAIKEDEAVVDVTAIIAANQHIQRTLKADDDEDSDSDSDDDNDDNAEEAAL